MTDRLIMPQRPAIDLPVAKLLHQPQIASQSDKDDAMAPEDDAISACSSLMTVSRSSAPAIYPTTSRWRKSAQGTPTSAIRSWYRTSPRGCCPTGASVRVSSACWKTGRKIDFSDDRDGCLFTATVHRKELVGSAEPAANSEKSSEKSSEKIWGLLKVNPQLSAREIAELIRDYPKSSGKTDFPDYGMRTESGASAPTKAVIGRWFNDSCN